MAAIAQTIAIVDKSGKVVSTTKQLRNVFKEAKMAYQERKADITAERKMREERELRKAIKAMSVADESRSDVSRSQSRSHRHEGHGTRETELRSRSNGGEHRHSSGSVRSGHSSPSSPALQHSPARSPLSRHASSHTSPNLENNHDYYAAAGSSRSNAGHAPTELIRRRTDLELIASSKSPRPLHRTNTSPTFETHIDMDLAYGEFHPEVISPRGLALTKANQNKEELNSLVLKCKMLLDEANCAQHSIKAVMAHLQKNPDAMAAVALTLAEISNIVTKMAPGALTMLKASAPTVFGLLAAPEFLIAVGLGVGLTVVMFGGYKIIKKIKAARDADSESNLTGRKGGVDEMIDVEELSRIECWRRGIADDQFGDDTTSMAGSVATSVEGEFISPFAERSMGHLPLPKVGKNEKQDKEKRRRRSSRSDAGSEKGSEKSSRSSKERKEKALVKAKKPSPLRRMFMERGISVAK
jgi:hypothetical protein